MSLKDIRDNIREEIQGIVTSDFEIIIEDTTIVPTIDDPNITYPNLLTKTQKCKLIETCVLYIDIRNSTELSLNHRRETMAKLYSSFARAMTKAGSYFNGKIRNIIGDRVMVVFDSDNCFTNAVNTAILMNSISKYVLNKEFPHDEIKCGIGIDYGKMLVTKTGIIRQGIENTSNKSLVWLGKPANIASKLTDNANKTFTQTKTIKIPTIYEGHKYTHLSDMQWYEFPQNYFLENRVKGDYLTPILRHVDDSFRCYFLSTKEHNNTETTTTKQILMTEEVFEGYKNSNPEEESIVKQWWRIQSGTSISGYSGKIYGGNVYYEIFEK